MKSNNVCKYYGTSEINKNEMRMKWNEKWNKKWNENEIPSVFNRRITTTVRCTNNYLQMYTIGFFYLNIKISGFFFNETKQQYK